MTTTYQTPDFTKATDLAAYTVTRLSTLAILGPKFKSSASGSAELRDLILQKLAPLLEVQAENTFSDVSQLFLDSFKSVTEQFSLYCDDPATAQRVTKILEAALVFAANMLRATGATDVFLALTSFVQAVHTKSMSQSVYDLIISQFGEQFAATFQVQSFGLDDLSPLLDSLRGKFSLFANIGEVPIVAKMYKFVLYCLAHSMLDIFGITFDKLGYTKMEAEALRKAHASKAGFVFCLFDALTLFLKQFVRAVRSGSWEPFYHCTTTYEKFVDDAIALRNKEKFLSNPEPHGFDLFSFRAELEDAIDRGNTIMRCLGDVKSYERVKLKALLSELSVIKANDITRKSAQRDRPSPFGILLEGGSSLGKSTLITYLFQHYAKLHGRSSESTAKYTRNSAEKHWNGFSTSQWCIVLDDIAAQKPSLGTMDVSLSEVICVLNNVAFVPEQAALEDKGKTPVLAELVIASTNTLDLNAHAYFSCPLAVQRRLPWVVSVTVKPQYATNDMLDHHKCALAKEPGKFANYWKFRVQRIEPTESSPGKPQRGRVVLVETFTEVDDFLSWFGKETFVHNRVQTMIGEQEVDTNAILACTVCCRPIYGCSCNMEPQALLALDLVPFSFCGYWRDVATYWLEPFGVWWRYVRAEPWRVADTDDLWYTLTVFGLLVWVATVYLFLGSIIAYFSGFTAWACGRICGFDFERRFLRFMFRRMGGRIERLRGPIKAYVTLFASLAVATKIAHMGLSHLFPPQLCQRCVGKEVVPLPEVEVEPDLVDSIPVPQTSAAIGTRPMPGDGERTNVWYKEEFSVSTFDVTPQTLSAKALDRDQVRNMFRRNCVRIEISSDGVKWMRTGALALCGQLYAVNTHAFPRPGDQWMIRVKYEPGPVGVTRNKEFLVVASQLVVLPDTDLTFVAFRGLPLAHNILPYLALPSLAGKYSGEYMGYDKEGLAYQPNAVTFITKAQHFYTPGVPCPMYQGRVERLTVKGDCGSPLVVFTPLGPVILGIHALGAPCGLVMAMPIFADSARMALEQLRLLEMQAGAPLLTAPSALAAPLGPLDKRSVFRYVEGGSAVVYGSLLGFRPAPRSRVCRTRLADVAERFGYVQKCGPPVMAGWRPWRKAVLDMVEIPGSFRQDILDHCVESFTTDILVGLPKQSLAEVFVYDVFTAVNGAEGVAYVDKMKRNTSAGFPWGTTKAKFLSPLPPQHGLQDPVEFSDEIMDRVNLIIATYQFGRRVHPVFSGHLKDEPTKFAKIESCKTRVFAGAPVDWSIVERMYLLSFVRAVQTNRYVFESAPGTIAQSAEWGDMFHYLTFFGLDQIVAGDFQAFDKTMPSMFLLAAFEVIYNVAKAAGYSVSELMVVYGLGHDTAFSLWLFNGDLAMFYGSHPSGTPLCVVINGLAHALYMRYAYTVLNPAHECRSFKRNVHLMTYGDDGAMGISKEVPWFNHTTIKGVLAVHGVVYTMADKTAESVPYIHVDELTFLKRSWRFDPDVRAYLCPLDHSSIEKSIMTCVESKSVSSEYQAIAIVGSAVNEYFFYGREEFERRVAMLRAIVVESGLEPFVEDSTFPSFESLVERFHAYDVKLYWTPQFEETA